MEMKWLKKFLWVVSAFLLGACVVFVSLEVQALPSKCEECHKTISHELVQEFNHGKKAKVMTCEDCHGDVHAPGVDADKARLRAFSSCQACHDK